LLPVTRRGTGSFCFVHAYAYIIPGITRRTWIGWAGCCYGTACVKKYSDVLGVSKTANVNVSLQVLPVVPEERIYPVVDSVISMIAQSGVKYEVGPMETTMEGELDRLLEIVKRAQEICAEQGASRVVSIVKIDYKKEGVTMDEKVGKYRE
jgi:uncharacterized protein (TIGR00106 family)